MFCAGSPTVSTKQLSWHAHLPESKGSGQLDSAALLGTQAQAASESGGLAGRSNLQVGCLRFWNWLAQKAFGNKQTTLQRGIVGKSTQG